MYNPWPEGCTIWDQTVESHLNLARHVHDSAILDDLARRAGFAIDPVFGNDAATYADVLRYLKAVDEVLGRQAWISAKLIITNRMRELGLTADLPHASHTWAPDPAQAG